ncbi:MAG: alanine racemase [Actinobacteria bacterium]|nr:alanine racemase [Actinomycetota bacterium]
MTSGKGDVWENGRVSHPVRAVVSDAAIRRNVAALRARTAAAVMAVVKADAYGHGARHAARAAVEGGATWLGIAQVEEAVALAPDLPAARVLAWLHTPRTDLRAALRLGIDLGVGDRGAVEHVADTAAALGRTARVHLKVDTGMARGGVLPDQWPDLVRAALGRRELEVVGIWSHLARADEREDPTTARQTELFADAVARAEMLGAAPEVRHLAASAGLLWHPETHFDLVRPGISVYGMAPDGSDPAALGLEPAMRLEAELTLVKRVPAGTPVSYGHTATVGETTLGVVPLGYADGVPRQASNRGATVGVGGRTAPVVGRICMDQFVVDLGPDAPEAAGDRVTVWGPGGPAVEDWARAAGTINYTITTQVGPRVPRVHVEDPWT